MPFAEASAGLIDQHRARLDALTAGLDDTRATKQPAPGEWSVNETLLHLIGDTASFPDKSAARSPVRTHRSDSTRPVARIQAGAQKTAV